jgi:hypothetical protein
MIVAVFITNHVTELDVVCPTPSDSRPLAYIHNHEDIRDGAIREEAATVGTGC